ncbi:hypothetical protein POM88_001775 [Heracleum sosnowskyi]|uniref:Uncharacterized protein n=1 Tax=Heracleum sosnowskyi TaxID=360622 RepID=A0AAD8JCV8_9APIA|nr:hypothetical protein POM88_001775 [Heracleum sosnowskyi]
MDLKGNVIGQQQMLRFEINDIGDEFDSSKACHFRMHEYSLAGVIKGLKSAAGNDVVLCKITVDPSKNPVFNLVSESPDHGPTKRGKGQDIEQRKKKENFEKSVGNNPEGTRNITPTTVVEMDSGIGNNVEATSENCLSWIVVLVRMLGIPVLWIGAWAGWLPIQKMWQLKIPASLGRESLKMRICLGDEASGRGRVTCMASYKVKLTTPEGDHLFECPDDTYILDGAQIAQGNVLTCMA